MADVLGRRRNTLGALAHGAWLSVTVASVWLACVFSVQAAEPCSPQLARVVSVQGTVELRRGGAAWANVALNALLCPGDSLRVLQRSRAALLLSNETTLRLDQGTTLTLAPPEPGKPSLLDQLTGGMHVITRTPRAFSVKTPFVNANVEGTEFEVRVTENAATVAVVEGTVHAVNEVGSETLHSGEEATATRDGAPRKTVVVRPADAVAWTLYFPEVFDYRLAAAGASADAARERSIASYRAGRISDALAALDQVPEGPGRVAFLTYRAGLLLLVGRLDEAKPDLEEALRVDPRNSDAQALLAVAAVVENDKDRALDLARRAVEFDPASPAARIALSYAQQARFDVEQALASVVEAVKLGPSSALAQARRAELEMAMGHLDTAIAVAQEAVRLDAQLAKTQTVLGFAHLTRMETREGRASFERAIELDQADPLPRLGLGLAKIRDGDLAGGRTEIEIAAILDPQNSLIRSYLGKAYYEEKRDERAATQFGLATQRDPRDPTPYFYDAVRKQASNQPVEALRDLNRSIALNDNRAVYRSQLLIDDDRAARTTSLAALYGELGFERLAIVESVKALADNLGNDSAHRQLATAYANQPRHDIARVSEALQAQIRQPITLSPIDPQISTDNLGILRGSGPSRLGANEFNLLFARDQVRLQADGIAGSRGTWGDQVVVSGVAGKFAYSASQLHYETDGFRDNDSARKNAVDLFVQEQVSPHLSLQADVKHSDFRLGQTYFPFDPLVVWAQTITEHSDTARISGHLEHGVTSDWVFSLSSETRTRQADNFPDGSEITETHTKAHSFALQYLHRSGPLQLVLGLETLRQRDHQPIEEIEVVDRSDTLYAYGQWRVDPSRLSLQAGLAVEHFESRNSVPYPNPIARKRASPKLGIVWTPRPDTTLRAAAFSAVKRPFISSQTLEPTQVAGFNQFFTGFDTLYGDPLGTISRRVGLAVDHRFSSELFAGIEIAARRLTVPDLVRGDVGWKEGTGHVYVYDAMPAGSISAMPGWALGSSIEYEIEKIDRPQTLTGPEGVLDVTTHHLPIGVRLFRGNWAWRMSTTYVRQTGHFSADIALDTVAKSSSGWISDLSAEYRLPRRTGTLAVGVRNLSNKRLDLFQSDPFAPRDALVRFFYVRCRVIF